MSVAPARRAAYEVVRRVFEDDAYADRALRSASEGLDERDRAFARRLAYGTVQRVRTLDHAIEALGRRPVRKLDAPVRAALPFFQVEAPAAFGSWGIGCHVHLSLPVITSKPRTSPLGISTAPLSATPEPTTIVFPTMAGGEVSS